MQTVEFIDALKCGVPKIDNQHKALVDMINFLIQAREDDTPTENISFVLGEMNKYVYLHFRDEEQFMLENFFPGLAKHKVIHETFEAKVRELQQLYDEGETELLDEVLEFLTNWLVNHIQGEDLTMVQEIRSNMGL